MDALTVTHNKIEITYNEARNVWTFTLRGRERSADSLAKAREAIDRPPPKESKPFERFKAWLYAWGEGWEIVEVTSIVESPYSIQLWTMGKGGRSKQACGNLFPVGPVNDANHFQDSSHRS